MESASDDVNSMKAVMGWALVGGLFYGLGGEGLLYGLDGRGRYHWAMSALCLVIGVDGDSR